MILSSGPLLTTDDLPRDVVDEAGELEEVPDDEAETTSSTPTASTSQGSRPASRPASAAETCEAIATPAAIRADCTEAEAFAESALDQPGISFADAKRKALERFETRLLTRELARHRGNVTRTAQALGLHRQSLQHKLKELGLKAAAFRT